MDIVNKDFDFLGDNISYQIKGDEHQAIIFLHGNNSSKQFWHHQMHNLIVPGHCLMAIDLLGYGDSDKPISHYSFPLWAETVQAICIAEQIEQCILVGHSNGALVAREYYRRYAEKVDKIIMIEGSLRNLLNEDKIIWMKSAALRDDYHQFMAKMIRQMPMEGIEESDKSMMVRDTVNTPAHVNISLLNAMSDPDLWMEDRINIPVLMINAFSVEWTEEYKDFLNNLIPKLIYKEWQGSGHLLPLQFPNRLNQEIEDFIHFQDQEIYNH